MGGGALKGVGALVATVVLVVLLAFGLLLLLLWHLDMVNAVRAERYFAVALAASPVLGALVWSAVSVDSDKRSKKLKVDSTTWSSDDY